MGKMDDQAEDLLRARVREWLKAHPTDQGTLGKLLGWPQPTVSKWLKGYGVNAGLSRAVAIARLVGDPLDDILRGVRSKGGDDEARLLANYRRADNDGQRVIRDVAETVANARRRNHRG